MKEKQLCFQVKDKLMHKNILYSKYSMWKDYVRMDEAKTQPSVLSENCPGKEIQ